MNGPAPASCGGRSAAVGPVVLERLAVRLVFLLCGLGNSAWAVLVPFARARSGLGEAGVGLLLLCLGLGSVAAMPVAGALAARHGCRVVLVAAGATVSACLPLLAVLSGPGALMASLAVFGAGLGTLDVAMNIEAIRVERLSARPLMSGFHGLFSLGGVVGAGGLALLLRQGASPLAAAVCASVCVLLLLAASLVGSLSHPTGDGGRSGFAVPRGVVLLIGALCFVLFLAEGAVLDWSALLLSGARRMDNRSAGWGYAAFAAAMMAGRFCGDRIVAATGFRLVLTLGGLCAASGFALAGLAPSAAAGLTGFGLAGLGCANIVPLLFGAAGCQHVMPESAAVPAIATLGYAGMLAGPVLIGLLAWSVGLPGAFLLLAAMLVLVAVAGRGI